MSSALDTSVYLIRDFPVKKTGTVNDSFIRMAWKEVKVVHPPRPVADMEMEGELSRNVDAIQTVRQERVKLGAVFLFLWEAKRDNSRIGYDIHIDKQTVERICLILPPQPFLLVRLKEKGGSGRGDVEARWELKATMEFDRTDSQGYFKTRLLLSSSSSEAPTVPLCDVALGWTNLSRPIKLGATSFGESLFRREASKDVTIVAGNGAETKCHKLIFEANCDVFASMLSPGNGMKESETGRVEMPENSEEGVSHLIRYLYGMELKTKDIPCGIAMELFKTGDKYKLEQLVEALRQLLLLRGNDWYSPDDLVELYFYLKNLDSFKSLREHCISLMLSCSEEVRGCERFGEVERADAKAATELAFKLVDFAKKKLPTPTGNEPKKNDK